ncbi:integrase, catalytic region, zinc finger, CCHC-type containing protein [Tanacetum coccineum]
MLKDSITNGPYQMKEIDDPRNLTCTPIVEPYKRLQKGEDLEGNDKLRFKGDIDAMNFILLGIPNDIYNSVDACKTAQAMWNRVRRLMQVTDLSKQERDSCLSNEFDKFTSVTGESIELVYERFSRIMNDIDRHVALPKKIAINRKFLNSLQLEWSKYVTMVRLMHNLHEAEYDLLYDFLKQNKVNVNASRAKQVAKAHDPLALVANRYASLSHSRSSLAYYVTHLPSVDVQTKNVGNVGSAGRNTSRNVGSLGTDAYCYNCNEKGHYVRECTKPKVHDSNYFKQQILLAKQDKAGIHLDEEHNNFLLADILEDEEMEELNASCIMMARIKTVANDSDAEPS